MHFMPKPVPIDTRDEPRPDEPLATARDGARQAAASLLDAANMAEDSGIRQALRRRAAQLISLRRGGRDT